MINKIFEELNREGIETELVELAGEVIEPCKACWICGGQNNCVHKKDMFQEIFEKMKKADGILLGSTYWNMAYGQMPGDLEKDQEGLDNMANLGKNMAFLLKALEERT